VAVGGQEAHHHRLHARPRCRTPCRSRRRGRHGRCPRRSRSRCGPCSRKASRGLRRRGVDRSDQEGRRGASRPRSSRPVAGPDRVVPVPAEAACCGCREDRARRRFRCGDDRRGGWSAASPRGWAMPRAGAAASSAPAHAMAAVRLRSAAIAAPIGAQPSAAAVTNRVAGHTERARAPRVTGPWRDPTSLDPTGKSAQWKRTSLQRWAGEPCGWVVWRRFRARRLRRRGKELERPLPRRTRRRPRAAHRRRCPRALPPRCAESTGRCSSRNELGGLVPRGSPTLATSPQSFTAEDPPKPEVRGSGKVEGARLRRRGLPTARGEPGREW